MEFPETTEEEREHLRGLLEHPGWQVFKQRLRWMEVGFLREAMDLLALEKRREQAQLELMLLRRVEKLPALMLLERGRPLTKKEQTQVFQVLKSEELSEEHLDALD